MLRERETSIRLVCASNVIWFLPLHVLCCSAGEDWWE